ncbi:2,4-dienoyl-CoA reductase-like NADH-dependent reductase (Old Yellow Enzyme family) [Rhodoligotrophos appendicifer]|uniref:alkene reductase n=1 Tax=Rhodoligotrophos appendicifer TaxID=987056 RepID=UPI0011847DBE|nr:alkene reductase [Rhodoligotrophos appendicifer]
MPSLFDPLRIGAIDASSRIFMAPLTRARATREHVPTPLMVDYYRQRASAGLIISEATGISRQGLGWPYAPGIWTAEQVEAWIPITSAVHDAGGRIICQLWHMGRVVHPSLLGGEAPVSASATTAPGLAHTYEGKQPYAEARALRLNEIPGILEDYAHAARNALAAGFDGVQIHAANGYLIDQFLRDNSNFRTDAYGGSPENRMRLLREVTAAVTQAVGADRVAIRLSPNGDRQGVNDSDPESLFPAVARMLDGFGLAFLELREPREGSTFATPDVPPIAPAIRAVYSGALVLNSDYVGHDAQAALDAGLADAISFGRTFLANPDLPKRLAGDLPLNTANVATFYTQGPEGYVDYPLAS